MRLQFVGCGDAFGSGGRFNTCFHLHSSGGNALIDCGATSLIALKRLDIDRNAIDVILVTHFHGDHFGGIPFLVMEAQFVTRRERPLIIAGPRGVAERYAQAMDLAFPSSAHQPKRFEVRFQEIEPGAKVAVGVMQVEAFPVVHTPAAGPCLGYRINIDGHIIAYSGDTEWTETLIPLGRNADLFVCEAYTYEREVPHHTALAQLESRLDVIAPKRLILTHMSDDMLGRLGSLAHETASDGLIVEL